MKNREAAQSARDRKKAKMDSLDVSVVVLQEQNEKLRLENSLLREQNKLLSGENSKLKQRLAGSTAVSLSQGAAVAAPVLSVVSCRHVEVERSAESSHVTQPKVLLQQKRQQQQQQQHALLFQRLVYVLIVQTLGLLKVVSRSSPHYGQLVRMKDSLIQLDQRFNSSQSLRCDPGLKAALIKLVKLMRLLRHHKQPPPPLPQSSTCQALVLKKPPPQQQQQQQHSLSLDHMKLMLLVSVVIKSLGAVSSPAARKTSRN
jgi:hypothetical protein